ncbi:MAG: class I SAM-dependent methyltransferase [Deltaproteobacteria bacterium]|nr:class I SAM-dependent methyltransferase [Deltaproteobacteria bacterium]
MNQDGCARLERYLPQARVNIFELYAATVARYMNGKPHQTIVDVGGGKSCPFSGYRRPGTQTKIIAVDVSAEELADNEDVDEKRVANIMEHLPFEDGEVDIVVSRSVLEHLENLDLFVTEAARVLKKDGYFIHLFPSKFAPFSAINQLVPNKVAKRLLYSLHPNAKGICGFPAYYNKCFYSAIKSLLHKNGYEIVESHVSYYQASYFKFFVPFFLLIALYEIAVRFLGVKNLGAYLLIIAQKKTDSTEMLSR